jgi:hypothetical protein
MDPTLTAALIGLFGVLAGTLITIFSEELKSLVLRSGRANKDLLGRWRGTWCVTTKGKENLEQLPEVITDVIIISKVVGERIVATANNTEYGDYTISGRVSRSNLVTLHYEGHGRRQPIGGVIILKLTPTRDKMEGQWWEYNTKEEFIGGGTTWTKER